MDNETLAIWPRHHAERICRLTTRDERNAELDKVPSDLKELVKTHVKIFFERRANG